MTTTLQTLGDPQGMRPSVSRSWSAAGYIGHHALSDGQVASVTWLPVSQTHVHIVVWIPGTPVLEYVKDIARFHAAPQTEKLLQELES